MNARSDELVTQTIVDFVSDVDARDLPETVRHECRRSLLDSVGCIVGGSKHAVVSHASATLSEFFGPAQASLLGQGRRADLFNVALINGLAGAAYSYFDTYSPAHLHAGVVHSAVLVALSERKGVSGAKFLAAYACGMEIACRLTRAIALPPAEFDFGFSIGGVVSAVASALAGGKLLGLDREQLTWALGIGASGAAGTRAEYGTMTAGLIFGQAAQTGVRSAILASSGFTSSTKSIAGQAGYARTFSRKPNLEALTDRLGEHYEVLATMYKPYPTDIAIHPGIDAMIQLKKEYEFESRDIGGVQLAASRLAVETCSRPSPANELEAKFSLQHWVAAAAVYGKAQLDQGRMGVVQDPEVKRLSTGMELTANPDFGWHAIEMTVELKDGRRLKKRVDHCTGTAESPMSDSDLEAKFTAQVERSIGHKRAIALAQMCWKVESLPDAAALARAAC